MLGSLAIAARFQIYKNTDRNYVGECLFVANLDDSWLVRWLNLAALQLIFSKPVLCQADKTMLASIDL